MVESTPNYFVCTLGEAAELQGQSAKSYTTVNHLIEHQARFNPHLPAFAFPLLGAGSTEWASQIYSFSDLQTGSVSLANNFLQQLGHHSHSTVALLCPSSVDFVFSWLALMRAGFSVLIVAPQCQPAAIAHLCASCNVNLLIHDEQYSELARSASSAASFELICQPLVKARHHVDFRADTNALRSPLPARETVRLHTSRDIAFLFHTSGTSTGLPKPIPQSHHAAVGVLPYMDGRESATFTTTPLYHGGIADCLRAWTSSALIWLFPGADVPITSKNILSSVRIAERAAKAQKMPPIRYFASVPYILQMLAEENDGMDMLKGMDIVSVGGAALPPLIGDQLVSLGINLVSRFGSAECGFLLSSHRHYETDKEWQYLRSPANNQYLSFEPEDTDSGLSQLIVLPNWPHIAKSNLLDGGFATSDLFEPHPRFKNAWKYHSRSDSQITLSTGKKFDPAPVEDSICSASPLIKDVLIFGNGQQVPGLLVFLSDTAIQKSDAAMENELWEIVQNMNFQGQDHTRISRNMMTILARPEDPLPKSSKGTILRNIANDKYRQEIDATYNVGTENGASGMRVISKMSSEKDVLETVRTIVGVVTSNRGPLDDDADFYQHGIDSAMCSQIRGRLSKITRADVKLPWSIVYDCGNIAALSKHVFDNLHENLPTENKDVMQEMLGLAERYSKFSFQPHGSRARGSRSSIVLLTGATGSLGTHVLHILLQDPGVFKIVCLVRAKSNIEAKSRVATALTRRKLFAGQQQQQLDPDGKLVCYASSLTSESLGLPSSVYTELERDVTHVIHSAWAVNFSLNLRSFSDNIAGLHNLLALTIASEQSGRMMFCSSTASVLSSVNHPIHEKISSDPKDADSLGYSQSKWVAESICKSASRLEEMRGRVSVLRIGQLTGDTKNGIWNMSEAWPLMLSTVHSLGCLPRLEDEKLVWVPVDIAAKAVCEITLGQNCHQAPNLGDDAEGETCLVYHLVANLTPKTPTWSDLLAWIQNSSKGPFEIVGPSVWLEKLRDLESHPAQALLGLWDRAYGSQTADGQREGENVQSRPLKLFDTAKAGASSRSMRDLKLVDEALVGRIWAWLETEVTRKTWTSGT